MLHEVYIAGTLMGALVLVVAMAVALSLRLRRDVSRGAQDTQSHPRPSRAPVEGSWRWVAYVMCGGLLSGAVLAAVHVVTEAPLRARQQRRLAHAVLAAVPHAVSYAPVLAQRRAKREHGVAYATFDAEGRLAGYAVRAEGVGALGSTKLFYGLDAATGEVLGISMLDDGFAVTTPDSTGVAALVRRSQDRWRVRLRALDPGVQP